MDVAGSSPVSLAIILQKVLKKFSAFFVVNVPNVVKLEYKVICCNFLSHTEYTI